MRDENSFYDEHPRGIKYELSPHAIERALEMSIEGEEIVEAMERPIKSYFSEKHNNWCLTAGRVSIGVGIRNGRARITTVLWSTRQGWLDDYARGGDFGDRRPRSDIKTSL